jgi:hypothetical protein
VATHRSGIRDGLGDLDGPEGVAGSGRYVATGGWRRALIGLAVGVAAGAVIALVLPRDEGPRRRDLVAGLPPELRS